MRRSQGAEHTPSHLQDHTVVYTRLKRVNIRTVDQQIWNTETLAIFNNNQI